MTSNNGVGLPTEKAERIFDAFFTTKPQGSGMGLAISRSIVEPHGGRLWATPNDGRGTSFHITLPTATDAAEAAASRTQYGLQRRCHRITEFGVCPISAAERSSVPSNRVTAFRIAGAMPDGQYHSAR
jgi:hypothetical protein